MKKNKYLKFITKKSIKFLNELSEKGLIYKTSFSYMDTCSEHISTDSEIISYIGLPFMVLDDLDLNDEFKNKNKFELNKMFTKRIKQIGNFDYNLWRISKGMDKISLDLKFEKYSFNDEQIMIIDIFERFKLYKGNGFIEKYLSSFSLKQVIYTFGKLGYSCCVELPLFNLSYIILDNFPNTLENLFDFIHEIGHAIHNSFKYDKYKYSIENDETTAYFIQYEIITTIFPEYKDSFLIHLKELYKTNCVKYEFENHLYKFKSYNFKSRCEILKKILKKYKFSAEYNESWIYDVDYWNNPFYSGVYVKAIETLFFNNFDLNYVMP